MPAEYAGTVPAGLAQALERFDKLLAAIDTELALDGVLHLVAGEICALIGCSRCSVYLREADSETELYRGQVVESRRPEDDARVKRLVCGTEADGFTREILATKLPVLIRDAQGDGRAVRSAMRAWNVRSMLGVPMIVGDDVLGILFLDDEGTAHPWDSGHASLAATFAHLAGIAILQAQRSSQMRANLITIARQNELLRHSSAIEERLTRLALEGATLQDIATVVSDLTGKPCAIHDADYRRLAAGAPASSEAPVPSVLEDARRSIPEVAEALAALKPNRQIIIGPLPAVGLLHRFLVTSIVVAGREWGYLTVMEFGRRLTALDIAASRHSATAIACELSLERRAAVAERHERQALTRDLVNGLEDKACLVRRAELMGFRIASPHVVCLLRAEDDAEPLCVEDASPAWAGVGQPGPVWTTTIPHGGLAVIVELDEDVPQAAALARIKDTVERLRLQLDPERHVLAAISSPCRVPADYSCGYDEATRVLRFLTSLRRGQDAALSLLAANDLGAGRLLLDMVDGADAERFTRNTLGPLLNPHSRLAAELLCTVRVFFDSDRSIRTSAKRLGIHENTIRYRLARVLDLTGLDVAANADTQLTVQVALSILHIQGRLPTLDRGPYSSHDSTGTTATQLPSRDAGERRAPPMARTGVADRP